MSTTRTQQTQMVGREEEAESNSKDLWKKEGGEKKSNLNSEGPHFLKLKGSTEC